MGQNIEKTISERTKEFLELEGEHSPFELIDLLRHVRNDSHPDKFQEKDHKIKAEERFKKSQELAIELLRFLEADRLNRKPMEMAIYKPLYDTVQLHTELDTLKAKFNETTTELAQTAKRNEELTKKNEELTTILQKKDDDSLTSEIDYLRSIYKPSSKNFAPVGLGLVLTGALGAMTQMEKISNIIKNYAPFNVRYISFGLFVVFLLFLMTLLRKIWESGYIKSRSSEVSSPKFANKFVEYLKPTPSATTISEFSEVAIYDFIVASYPSFSEMTPWLGFQIFQPETTNRLKDIFIHSALSKRLIEISKAEMMQRYFKIITTNSMEAFWYQRYQEEKEKNQK